MCVLASLLCQLEGLKREIQNQNRSMCVSYYYYYKHFNKRQNILLEYNGLFDSIFSVKQGMSLLCMTQDKNGQTWVIHQCHDQEGYYYKQRKSNPSGIIDTRAG